MIIFYKALAPNGAVYWFVILNVVKHLFASMHPRRWYGLCIGSQAGRLRELGSYLLVCHTERSEVSIRRHASTPMVWPLHQYLNLTYGRSYHRTLPPRKGL
jgi:hypothetical protein